MALTSRYCVNISLIDRLRDTETSDHFLCREIELDQAYFYADYELKDARAEELPETRIGELSRIREHVIRAHDYVGESNIHAAIEELNVVVSLKIGL